MYFMPTMTPHLGFQIYNGALLSRPCNPVMLSTAERMVDLNFYSPRKRGNHDRFTDQLLLYLWNGQATHNWYDLILLARAVAEKLNSAELNTVPHLAFHTHLLLLLTHRSLLSVDRHF